VRSTENAAIHVLRGIEDEGSKRRAAEIVVYMATPIALYILNHKRDRLHEIELRYAMRVTILGDDTQVASQFRIDRVRPQVAREDALTAITPDAQPAALPAPRYEPEEVVGEDEADLEVSGVDEPFGDEPGGDEPDGDDAGAEDNGAEEAGGEAARAEGAESSAEQAERRRRRRRRRRGGRREDGVQSPPAEAAAGIVPAETEPTQASDRGRGEQGIAASEEDPIAPETHIEGVPEHAEPVGEDDARRRRGRRGGRRRRREPGEGEGSPFADPGAEQPDLPPVYIGPTPANPFGGQAFDIFDVLEQAEASAAVRQELTEPMIRQEPAEPVVLQSLPEPALPEPALPEQALPEPVLPEAAAVAAPIGHESPAAPDEPEVPAATAEPAASAARTAQEIVNATAPEPAATEAMGEPAAVEPALEDAGSPPVSASEPGHVEVANDVAPEPAIRPILIGSGEEVAVEKKRGWWRR
jgi:ribonuclease E